MNLQRVFLRSSLMFGVFLCQIHVPAAMGQVRPRVLEAVDDARRITLSGNVHPLARAEFDRGAVVESQPINRILLLLKRSDEQEAALQDALAKLQDKSSPAFHQWLTPEQFGAQYGPADADIQAVTDWLTRQGFTIGKIYSGKTVIEFSGTAGQVQRAFGTAIHNYQVNGKTYSANASDPQIPAALAPVVTGVVSLHNFPRKFYARRFGAVRRGGGKSLAEPLTTFPNPFGPGSFYGLGPGDFAKIYGVPATCGAGTPAPPCNGAGQTIAIVGETNLNVSDVQQFRSIFGLPATFDANSIVYNGEDPGITSPDEEGEALLDTQWSGGAAPGATIKYVLSASTPASQGIDLSALYIVEHNLAGVMSESYGDCEKDLGTSGNSFYNALWEQASAQGITVMVSSGDGGSAGCDDFNTEQPATQGIAVSGLAGTPFNVSVGGTDFDQGTNPLLYWNTTNDATGTSAKGYIPEIPWNESCAQIGVTGCGATAPNGSLNIVAGSGGPSVVYPKPTWQMGVNGMPKDNHRDQPDVSLFASAGFTGTGYLYCQSDATAPCSAASGFSGSITFGVIGGTSASAPSFAGIMALVNQSQMTTQNPAPRQGNANYILYAMAKMTGASCASSTSEAVGCVFNDVVGGNSFIKNRFGSSVGTNSVACQGGTANCSVLAASSNGVLVDPAHPTTEAWTAAPGYDMATGLGTVNVGNLVATWGKVSVVPTTTTLTLTPTSGITHGPAENVSVNVVVTAKSGTATGVVSLIAKLPGGTTLGAGEFTLGANGSVSGTTTSLPGGSNYSVYAHYSGDGTNAPSDSTPVSVSVSQETSQTFIVIPSFDANGHLLSGNTNSVPYGSNYIIRMYVTDKNALASATGPPSPTCQQENQLTCPTGTVTLTDGGTLVGTGGGGAGIFNLNNDGYTRDLSPNIPGGTHALMASYSGDSSYQKSTSATTTLTIVPAATVLGFTNNPIPLVGVPVTMQLSGGPDLHQGVPPTGTVSIYDGTTLVGGPVAVVPEPAFTGFPSDFSASIPITYSASGDHQVTAKYTGDSNYAASTSAVLTVHPFFPTTTTETISPQVINYGQSVTVTATVISGTKTPVMTGSVSFQGYVTAISGPVTQTLSTDASGNQILTATVTTTPQGTEPILATYSGDSNFQSTQGNLQTVTVNIPDFTLTTPSALSTTVGQSASATLTIAPVSNTPSTVTVSVAGGAPPGTTLTVNPATVNLAGAPVQVTLTLSTTGAAPTAVVAKPQIKKAGALGVSPGNWWEAFLAGAAAFVFVLGIPGRKRTYRAMFALLLVCVSTFGLSCGGGGGSSGGGGGGGGGATPTSITISSSSPKIANGGSVTLTASVSASQAISGGVVFYQNGAAISSIPVVNSEAAFTLSNPGGGPGIYTYTASFNGDAKNKASTTATGVIEEFEGSVPLLIQANTGTLTHSTQIQISLQ